MKKMSMSNHDYRSAATFDVRSIASSKMKYHQTRNGSSAAAKGFLDALAVRHESAKVREQRSALRKKLEGISVSLVSMSRCGSLFWISNGKIWDLHPGKHTAQEIKEAAERQGFLIRWMEVSNGGHGNKEPGQFSMMLEHADGRSLAVYGKVPAGTYKEGSLL